jgi:hypothetical protein
MNRHRVWCAFINDANSSVDPAVLDVEISKKHDLRANFQRKCFGRQLSHSVHTLEKFLGADVNEWCTSSICVMSDMFPKFALHGIQD